MVMYLHFRILKFPWVSGKNLRKPHRNIGKIGSFRLRFSKAPICASRDEHVDSYGKPNTVVNINNPSPSST
jgi:hypothetical protein